MPGDQPFQPDPERIITDLEALKVYFDPVRLKIMKAVGKQARSVGELAGILNVPFTRLYYHINLLEKHDLIRLAETRLVSGAVEEKYYRATAHMFIIDRSLLTIGTPEGDEGLQVILSAVLDQTKADITRSSKAGFVDLKKLTPDPASLFIRRGVYHLTHENAEYFHQRMRELMIDMMSRDLPPEDEDAQYYGFAFAIYPSSMETPEALPDLPDADSSEKDE